jgi:superfamily II DNA or RNA helicase
MKRCPEFSSYDTGRNQLIVNDLTDVVDQKKSILVLTERKAHIDVLNLYLKDRCETIALSGDDSKRSQKSKMGQIKAGHFQIVLTTGQFFGEGIDIDRFVCLFLVYPFAFKGKLIQYIGRITRSDKLPVIYDYRDRHIEYFEKLFKKRNNFYDKIRKANQMTLEF